MPARVTVSDMTCGRPDCDEPLTGNRRRWCSDSCEYANRLQAMAEHYRASHPVVAAMCAHPDCDRQVPAGRLRWCSEACKNRRPRTAAEKAEQAAHAAAKRTGWTPAQQQAARDYAKAWRKLNRDTVKRNNRAAYLADPQAYAEARDRWRRENAAAFNAQAALAQSRRRTLKRAGDARRVTAADWQRLLNRAGGRCTYCARKAFLTMDHVVPLARGGRHAIGNLAAVCETCNKRKGALLLTEWRFRDAVEARSPRRRAHLGLARSGVDDGEPGRT